MTNAKLTRRALLSSVLALVLCFTMLLGTTFAWFTDEAVSSGNKIIAGNLDVELLLGDGAGTYSDISNSTATLLGGADSLVAQNNNADTLWEPGKTQVAYLAIKNAGNLDLKYQVVLEAKNEVNNLCDVMQYAITPDAKTLADVGAWTSAQANSVSVGTQIVSVNEEGGTDLTLKKGETHYFALSIHMDENAGNAYKNGEVVFDITVRATQLNSELDSIGPDYDKDAPLVAIVKKTVENTATTTATVTVGGVDKTATVIAENNTVEIHNGSNADDTIADADDATVAVTLPAGVVLEDGATELQLVTKETDAHENVTLTAGNVTVAYEIKVEGVVEATDDLIEVTLKGALPKNLTKVEVYHDGVKMSTSAADGEYFVYDFNTGDVTLYVKHFSNFTFSGEKVDMTTIPEGAILVSTADELKKALDDAKSGDTIAVVENIADAAITVDKSVTITGHKTLNNVSITASGKDVELTVSGLNFTGNSYINANDAKALTVTGVTADVDPAKCGGNGRAAFIVLGTSEPTHGLKLTVTNNTIKSAQSSNEYYSTAIFGWRYIDNGSEISNNVFGAEDDRYNFVAVKTMNAMDGAVITIENNTVYGTNKNWSYKAFDLYQNCSRENTYTVMSGKNVIHTEVVDTSTYTAVAFYLEDNNDTGSNIILLDNGTTVNGNALTLNDISNTIGDYDKYYGVDVTVDENGKLTGGTYSTDVSAFCADGYTCVDNTVVIK